MQYHRSLWFWNFKQGKFFCLRLQNFTTCKPVSPPAPLSHFLVKTFACYQRLSLSLSLSLRAFHWTSYRVHTTMTALHVLVSYGLQYDIGRGSRQSGHPPYVSGKGRTKCERLGQSDELFVGRDAVQLTVSTLPAKRQKKVWSLCCFTSNFPLS